MEIILNGTPYAAEKPMTIAALLSALALGEDRVAVECNLEIVPRCDWGGVQLKAGDRVEIINFVGGGR